MSDNPWERVARQVDRIADMLEYPRRPQAITVEIVRDHTGSHVEPALDQDAADVDKLAWRIAVMRARTGFDGRLDVMQYRHNFAFTTPTTGYAISDFHNAWSWLNGVEDGLLLAGGV